MISPKRLIAMAKKRGGVCETPPSAALADKGHFVVYSKDGSRFMVPLVHLKSDIFRELLKMSEDEFGLRGDGPIVLPCDAAFLEHALSVLRSRSSSDAERELFTSLSGRHCSSSSSFLAANSRQLAVSIF